MSKLKLEEIEVKSFVTPLKDQKECTVKGGFIVITLGELTCARNCYTGVC
ncbi:MAG: pinensin family lanthipeptide [Acidobacteriota bacterium]|nr:pinensin family lanthipeptide [Acidobacteriota bacterium]